MSTFTTYKNLEMPTNEDRYNVNIFNRNSDIVDSELHKLELKNKSQDNLLATNRHCTKNDLMYIHSLVQHRNGIKLKISVSA